MDPIRPAARRAAMISTMRSLLVAALVIVLAACRAGGTIDSPSDASTPSSPPTDAPSETPGFGAIEHPTGPTDVVLRLEEGGGFIMPTFRAIQAPTFTLYGDGTVLFRNPSLDPLEPVGSVYSLRPFRTARLTEEQMQEVLLMALGEGGLGIARANYPNDMIADASTAVFTVNAGGLSKTVSIYALGLEIEGVPDAPARAAFLRLAGRLADFDAGGSFATSEYTPERYRGTLLEGQPGAPDSRPWPWTDIAPEDFVTNPDPNAFPLPARVMTVAEVEELGIEPYQGGFTGPTLIGPGDGRVYSFALRPLLPGEAS